MDYKIKTKKMFRIYEFFVVLSAVFYLGYNYAPKINIIELKPIYRDAIKAVDPLEILKRGVGSPSDRAEY